MKLKTPSATRKKLHTVEKTNESFGPPNMLLGEKNPKCQKELMDMDNSVVIAGDKGG